MSPTGSLRKRIIAPFNLGISNVMRLNRAEWRDVDIWREVLEPRSQVGIVLRLGQPIAQMHLQHPRHEPG